jgi:hypothetical protein
MSTAETLRFICSACGYRARIPQTYQGKVILCPKCQAMQIASPDGGEATGDTVRVSKVATAQTPAGQVSVADAEGKIRFTCTGCGFHAKLAATYAGKAIACPKCQAPQLIPPLGPPPTGGAEGKVLPPSAPEPTADDDGIEFDLDSKPTAAAAQPAPAAPVSSPVDDPADHLSFDDVPDQPVPVKPAPAKPAAPIAKAEPKPKAEAKKVTTSVVRRGSRKAQPEPEPEPEEDDEEEEASAPRPPPAIVRSLMPLLERLREPRMLAATIGGGVAFILLIVCAIGWWSASGAASEARARAKAAEDKLGATQDVVKKREWERDENATGLDKMTKERDKAKADLKASLDQVAEAEAKAKKAEGEVKDEYAKRKEAEDKYDTTFTKVKQLEAKSDQDYKDRLEAEKKFQEEARLRKDIEAKLKEALTREKERLAR